MIKKIHLTTKDKILDEFQENNKQLLQKKNTDFVIRVYDDKELLETLTQNFPKVKSIWNQMLGIQKSDLGRYGLLYEYGGFYADTDIISLKSLTELHIHHNHEVTFAPSTKIWPWLEGDLTNYFIYAHKPKSEVLKLLIEKSIERISTDKTSKGFEYVPKTTGRKLILDVLKTHPKVGTFKTTEIVDLFCPCTNPGDGCIAYHAGSTSRSGSTWHKNYSLLIVKIECSIRKYLKIKGNISQAPISVLFIAICILIWIFIFSLL